MQSIHFSSNLHTPHSDKAKPCISINKLTKDGEDFAVMLKSDESDYSSLTLFVIGKAQLRHLRESMARCIEEADKLLEEEPQP